MTKPMLAYKVGNKEVDWSQEVFMQPKLDGVRCLISKDGAVSRTGKPWKNIEHIIKRLQPFFKSHPNHVLDGELYNHKLKDDFEKIISLVRKQKPTKADKLEARNLVQFHAYDCINQANKNYSARLFEMQSFDIYGKYIKLTYTEGVYQGQPEHARQINKRHLAEGYEGSMMRLDKPYEQKRSYNLQKWKDFHDTEATIIGYEAGKGKREGTLGKFLMQDDDGIEFGCPPGKGYTYKDLANIQDNIHDYIGKRATFTYFERTKAGSYRHPLFKTLRNYE
tara:strand:- start:36 stop:872 length:837 start_codon:yes stop_codon:yes gene_type:complete